MNISYAAFTFSSFPLHFFTALFCKALPKVNDKFHGFLIFSSLLMQFKAVVASFSARPPERKLMLGTQGGTVWEQARTVRNASSSKLTTMSLLSVPGRTKLGLRMMPSKNTLLSYRTLIVPLNTFSIAFSAYSMSCPPSATKSGSIIGTNLLY